MALNIRFEMLDTGIAKITLAGELDASTAPQFQKEVEKAAQQKARRLALVVTDLEYIASAGLRVLVFAKQKMGAGVDVYVIGAQEQVMETIRKTGLQNSVVSLKQYDAAVIETL
ncbi:MAG: anti-sigma factor antagonist [Spirochaetia bacterium]|jgi:anti-anti-sigma factor